MNTHIIIPIADLEAVIKTNEKQLKFHQESQYVDPDSGYLKSEVKRLTFEIAAYEKILTHYKKVDLSEDVIQIKADKIADETYYNFDDREGIELAYKQAIKDILL